LKKTENNEHISNKSIYTSHQSEKNYLVKGQLAVHGSQLKLQLANLTVQATNRGKDSVLLFPVIQENVVTLQIHHISLQMLDAGLEVRLLMLKPHPLKQRFLVLFQVLTAPKPPVTNYRKSVTFKNTKPHEKTTNSLKSIEEYDTNILPKTSNLQENGQLLKKAEKRTTPPTISTVPYPLQHSQTGRKTRTVPPFNPSYPSHKLYRPDTSHSGITQRKYMTRPAREILTDPEHQK
jgi:hypothetical protein